jgi:hypothetical protein
LQKTMFTSSSPSALASRLAYAGLIPFILLAALLWIVQADLRPWLTIALTSYAALIASFLDSVVTRLQPKAKCTEFALPP